MVRACSIYKEEKNIFCLSDNWMYMTVIIFFLLESYSSRYCATGCLKNIRFMFESEKKMQICVHSAFSPENEKVRNYYIPFGKLNCHVLVRLNFGDFI